MKRRPTEHYITEKIEAYNLAINYLYFHEPASDEVNPKQAKRLRHALAARLERERDKWIDSLPAEN